MRRFIQKPLVLTAIQSRSECTIDTLEGPERVHPGDWVVTGIRGERWPVSDSVFRKKYEPLPNEPGKFKKRRVEVYAEQLDRQVVIETPRGNHQGKPGDWLVREVDSDAKYICAADVFDSTYEPVD